MTITPAGRTRALLAVVGAALLAATAACTTPTTPGSSGQPTPEPSSTTSPSPVPTDPPSAVDPTPIPDDDPRLGDVDEEVPSASWTDPGTTLAVLIGGSGSSACVPDIVGATVEGPSAITVSFTPPEGDMMCTADFRVYGWDVPLDGDVDADVPVTVTFTGLSGDGSTLETTVEP